MKIKYEAWIKPERIARDESDYPQIPGGHVWYRETYGLVDAFHGVSEGFHNGPECMRCHLTFCEHCSPHHTTEPCPQAGEELPGLEYDKAWLSSEEKK